MPQLTPLTRDVLGRVQRPIPRFGSPEWDALPEDDLRRVAAVLIAAEAWRDHCSVERVREDLRAAWVAEEAAVIARLDRARADVHETLPSLTQDPWWVRVTAAEKACQEDARRRFNEWTAREQR